MPHISEISIKIMALNKLSESMLLTTHQKKRKKTLHYLNVVKIYLIRVKSQIYLRNLTQIHQLQGWAFDHSAQWRWIFPILNNSVNLIA